MPDASRSVKCYEFVDEPHNVVIVLDQEITCAQSQELGAAIGRQGFTARFVAGGIAEFGAKYAAWLRKHGVTWQA